MELKTTEQPEVNPSRLTVLLNLMQRGDSDAAERAVRLVYGELHRIAANRLAHERPGHSLQATALINEAYLRLMGADPLPISSRRHFLALASEQMRRILVDHARSEHAGKRGGDAVRVCLDDVQIGAAEQSVDVLSLNEALNDLQQLDPRAAQVVVFRYFGGGGCGTSGCFFDNGSPRLGVRSFLVVQPPERHFEVSNMATCPES